MGGLRRVLLINPKDEDIIRAHNIVRRYRAERMDVAVRPRRHFVCYTLGDEHRDPAYVWHTGNQITIHFGDEDVSGASA